MRMWSREQSEDTTVWFTQEGDREAAPYAERGYHQKLRRCRSFHMNVTRRPHYVYQNSIETRVKRDHINHSTQFQVSLLTCLCKIWHLGVSRLEVRNLNFINVAWKMFHHKMTLCCEGCLKKRTAAVIKADINSLNYHQVTSLDTRPPTAKHFLGWIPVNSQLQYLKFIASIQRHYKNRTGRDGSGVNHQCQQSTRHPIGTTQIMETRAQNMLQRVSAYLNQQ